MKRFALIMAAGAALVLTAPVEGRAQSVNRVEAEAAAARMNRDGYPYTLARPIIPPREKQKIREHARKQAIAEQKRAVAIRAQFRAMSADERRMIIERYGFPEAVRPGFR